MIAMDMVLKTTLGEVEVECKIQKTKEIYEPDMELKTHLLSSMHAAKRRVRIGGVLILCEHESNFNKQLAAGWWEMGVQDEGAQTLLLFRYEWHRKRIYVEKKSVGYLMILRESCYEISGAATTAL